MKTRILTALVCIPLLVLILISNSHIVATAVSLVALIGVYELFKATGVSKSRSLCVLGYIGSLALTLRFYIPDKYYALIFYIFVMALFFIMLKEHKTVNIGDGALTVFGMVYVPYFLSFLTEIYGLSNGNLFVWLVVAGAFLTDTCAYFSGIFLGRHKLCPQISPKKTIEGSVGGVLGCILGFMLCGYLFKSYADLEVNYVKMGAMGLCVAVISQIGDLTASIIKRKYGIKDYGSLFPGHGGVLDRFDSIITTAPLVYMFLKFIGIG